MTPGPNEHTPKRATHMRHGEVGYVGHRNLYVSWHNDRWRCLFQADCPVWPFPNESHSVMVLRLVKGLHVWFEYDEWVDREYVGQSHEASFTELPRLDVNGHLFFDVNMFPTIVDR